MVQRIIFSLILFFTVQFLTIGSAVSADAGPEDTAGKLHQDKTAADKEETWTVFIYGSCDSNLSDEFVCDLEKIETVGSSAAFRIVGQVDFDASMEKDNTECGLPPELSYGVTRFLFEKSDDPDHVTSKPLERLPELPLDNPRVLLDFLNWGFTKFPADHYGLVLSNHGGGWYGFGWDSQNSAEDYDSRGMKPEEMAAVIRSAMSTHRIPQLDFIGYDACLMASMEVIDYYSGLCHYFIADPEVDFGDGWNFGPTLGWLKEHPNTPLDQFAQKEVQDWAALHMEDGNDGDLTQGGHVAIDMTKYPQVKKNFDLFCRELAADYSPESLVLPKMRRMASEYGGDANRAPGEVAESIDLGDFARGFAQSKEVSPRLQEKAKMLADSIDAMITAKALGVDKYGASGLSIWYPIFHEDDEESEDDEEADSEEEEEEDGEYEDDEYEDEDDEYYADDDDEDDWTDIESIEEKIQESFEDYYKLSLFRESKLWPNYLKYVSLARENFNVDELLVFHESAYKTIAPGEPFSTHFTINDSAGAFQLHGTLLRKSPKATTRFTMLGEVITANLNGSGTYNLHWNPILHYLCGTDDESAQLALYPKNSIGNYFTACAEYQETPDDDIIDIQILILFDDYGKGRILSVLQDGEDLSPIPVTLEPGGIVTPDYWREIRKGDDPDLWKGKYVSSKQSVTVPPEGIKGLTIKSEPLPPGQYSLEFEVENVNAEVSEPFEVPLKIKAEHKTE